MSSKDVIGQKAALEYLMSCVQREKLASGYLFIGKSGLEKSALALVFAKMLNCEMQSPQPCERCGVCKRIEAGNYPDLYWVKRGEDEESIKIDALRAMQEKVYLKPFEGRKKVFVIEGAEYMTEEAANCILKTLEEPPLDTVIILTAEDTAHLLPTIVSRCKLVKFSPASGYDWELDGADLAQERERIIGDFLREGALPEGYKKRDFQFALKVLYIWHRDLLISGLGMDEFIANSDRKAELKDAASALSVDEILRRIALLEDTYNSLKFNANVELAQTVLALNLKEKEI